ncbi:MAG TPA: MTH1187 family thiamine-binding protein [Methanothrix sp.]|nr:MTH1187 family thiamine-binding protein [Methanothrix sp.]
MIVADFAMVPMGAETSAARYIRAVYDVLEGSGVNFVPGPMSTSIETRTMKELFDLIESANTKVAEMGVKRIITSINIDYRLDKEISIESKMSASKMK